MTTLFHYTSLPTFLAIIQTRSVRFCELSQSNDRAEGIFLLESLRSLMVHTKVPDHIQRCVSHILERLIGIYAYFGFCMTSEGDDLGQWRAYASNGTGVSIGFNLERLVECARSSPISISTKVSNVRYGKEAILESVEDLFEALRQVEDANPKEFWSNPEAVFRTNTGDEKRINDALMAFSSDCYDIKNPSFRLEKETRITQEATFTSSSFLKFFSRSGRIVPYYDVDLTSDCIDCVIAGPQFNGTPNDIQRVLTSWSGDLGSKKIYRSISSSRS
jgi:Protein of unknown function (DUF2971)